MNSQGNTPGSDKNQNKIINEAQVALLTMIDYHVAFTGYWLNPVLQKNTSNDLAKKKTKSITERVATSDNEITNVDEHDGSMSE